MQIINGEYPPNYKDIAKVFKITGKPGIVFTYGSKLYVPSGHSIDRHLLVHEETHEKQQNAIGVEEWWSKFLSDPNFRFVQELEAYRNQYRSMWSLPLKRRLGYLDHIAGDLSGEMYGNLMTKEQAIKVITDGIILKRPDKIGSPRKKVSLQKLKKRHRQNRKKGRK